MILLLLIDEVYHQHFLNKLSNNSGNGLEINTMSDLLMKEINTWLASFSPGKNALVKKDEYGFTFVVITQQYSTN